MSMGEALRTISFKVKTAACGGTQCVNSFGDEQLAVDMLANKLLFEVRPVLSISFYLTKLYNLIFVLHIFPHFQFNPVHAHRLVQSLQSYTWGP